MDDKILFEIARGLSRIADCMETAQKNNRVAEPSASDNTTKAKIAELIADCEDRKTVDKIVTIDFMLNRLRQL